MPLPKTNMTSNLPIITVLPALKAALSAQANAVLVAPPGAGKTTTVPLALLDEPWAIGRKIILLSPRRLAARAAAARLADQLGEQVGRTVGYRVRLDSKVSAVTRIEVVTEGVLTRRLIDQPDLPDVAAIIFDECHERSLEGDTALAFALDAQAALRPDLRLLAMSATLDGARVASLLGAAPVIESKGRQYPIETIYRGREPRRTIEAQMADAIHAAFASHSASILAFLPGAAEIRRTQSALRLPDEVRLYPLYGALDLQEQQAALAPMPSGGRKVVLATSIAETSLTIDGVSIVIDSGLSRRPRFDPASGLTRLVTERVSQAAANQRRGRAGRLGPGICYRLWDEAETRGLLAFDPPEILQADMLPLLLDLASWGVRDPGSLRWLDPPPTAACQQARRLLIDLGALDDTGGLTDHGRVLSRFGLHPRLAHAILRSSGLGLGGVATEVAALLTEHGLGGQDVDLGQRLTHFRRDTTQRARAARQLSKQWSRQVGCDPASGTPDDAGAVVALAFPERVAKARGPRGQFQLASGRLGVVEPGDPLAAQEFLAIAELTGGVERGRIVAAAAINETMIHQLMNTLITSDEDVRVTPNGTVVAVRRTQLGALVLQEQSLAKPSAVTLLAALVATIRERGLDCLPWTDEWRHWQARVSYLWHTDATYTPWPDISDAALLATLENWLAPFMTGKDRLGDLTTAELGHALSALLTPDQSAALARLAPPRLETLAGTSHLIDYTAAGGPMLACRVQELFGMTVHPTVRAGAEPLTLQLLSPAHRPIQTTKDLPGFWAGSWRAVKAEMKGRYPKHVWPDDPATTPATTRAKPRGT